MKLRKLVSLKYSSPLSIETVPYAGAGDHSRKRDEFRVMGLTAAVVISRQHDPVFQDDRNLIPRLIKRLRSLNVSRIGSSSRKRMISSLLLNFPP